MSGRQPSPELEDLAKGIQELTHSSHESGLSAMEIATVLLCESVVWAVDDAPTAAELERHLRAVVSSGHAADARRASIRAVAAAAAAAEKVKPTPTEPEKG